MNASASSVPALFELEGVSYAYHGRQPALREVDLRLWAGERVVILGANGSGKSTLLKVLDGLYRPTAGRISAFGADVTGVADDPERARDYHRRVGLVFQDPDVQLFSPTVWDDVAFGPLQLGQSEADVRASIQAALELMRVTHLADRAPYELSGGEKKRVAIATVLAIDPEVILLDEPTANLDPRSRAALVDLIVELARLGKTIVTTTHELDIVPIIADRVVVFGDADRRPIADGAPSEILAQTDLLVRANLIHEHLHYHGAYAHTHPHTHEGDHAHGDDGRHEELHE